MVIATTAVRTDFDSDRATRDANKLAGRKDQTIPFRLDSLQDTTDLLARSIAWTQQDDAELRELVLHVTDGTAGRTVTARLTVDGTADATTDQQRAALTKFLCDKDVEVSITTINGTVDGRQAYTSTTGTRVKLLRGVRYRLEIEDESAGTTITGPLQAAIQLRSQRRGGAGGICFEPHAFHANGLLDPDKINANLQQIARDIQDSIDARYTHSIAIVPIDIVDTDNAVLRRFPLRRHTGSAPCEVVGVELVGTDVDTGATWTLEHLNNGTLDSLWPAISVEGEGANVEVYASTSVPFTVDSSNNDEDLRLTADTATGNTFTGYLVVHLRADRWLQGSAALLPYEPQLFDAATATTQARFEDEFTTLEACAAADSGADEDLRCEVFAAMDLAPAATKSWRVPGGESMTPIALEIYIVAAATATGRVTLAAATTLNSDIAGIGVTARNHSGVTASIPVVGDDPTDSADDLVVTLENKGTSVGDALLLIAVLWFN